MSEPEQYLGDGLYASFDGHQVILRAPRIDGDHWVGLEPIAMHALFNYLETLVIQYPDLKLEWRGAL
jgi:hypothetical protein